MSTSTPTVCSPVAINTARPRATRLARDCNDEHLCRRDTVDHNCGEGSQDRERQQRNSEHDGDRGRIRCRSGEKSTIGSERDLSTPSLTGRRRVRPATAGSIGASGVVGGYEAFSGDPARRRGWTPPRSRPPDGLVLLCSRCASELHPQPCGYFFRYPEARLVFLQWWTARQP